MWLEIGIEELNFSHCRSKPTVFTEHVVVLLASSCNDGSNGDSGGSRHYWPVGKCVGYCTQSGLLAVLIETCPSVLQLAKTIVPDYQFLYMNYTFVEKGI